MVQMQKFYADILLILVAFFIEDAVHKQAGV